MPLKSKLLFAYLIASIALYCQTPPVGTWRYHYFKYDVKQLETVDDQLVGNNYRNLQYLTTKTSELESFDKTNGLSDYNITSIRYHDTKKLLFVAYSNSIIDILDYNKNKKIYSNYDIFNKLTQIDKSINKIEFFGDKVYFCSNYGIIVYDIANDEIDETYVIGPNGLNVGVKALEELSGKWLAATDTGLLQASQSNANLQNYQAWTFVPNVPKEKFLDMEMKNGAAFIISKNSFYTYRNPSVTVNFQNDTTIQNTKLKLINNNLYWIFDKVTTNKSLVYSYILRENNGQFDTFVKAKEHLSDIAQSKEGDFYVAAGGITRLNNGQLGQEYTKYGPKDNVFRIQWIDGKVYVNSGMVDGTIYTTAQSYEGNYITDDAKYWGSSNIDEKFFDSVQSQTSILFRNGKTYRSFISGGLSEQSSSSTKLLNSKLELFTGANQVRVSDIVMDSKKTIWIANVGAPNPLKSLDTSGVVRSHSIASATSSREIRKIIVDDYDNKWIATRNGGLVIYNEKDLTNPNDDISVSKGVLESDNLCKIDVTRVLDFAIDKDGLMWIGSTNGIGTMYCDENLSCQSYIPGQKIQNPKDPTDSTLECLFIKTAITAIAIDEGNNKWIGTGGGLFYISEGGTLQYIKLNSENSPMPDVEINDILVQPNTGTVYITTPIGLFTFEGQSTMGVQPKVSSYKITPNPVPKDYTGLISIDGIADGALYKITDNTGRMIYQGRANGGRITWDGRMLNGAKPATGVYYILSGQTKGTNMEVGILTIIN